MSGAEFPAELGFGLGASVAPTLAWWFQLVLQPFQNTEIESMNVVVRIMKWIMVLPRPLAWPCRGKCRAGAAQAATCAACHGQDGAWRLVRATQIWLARVQYLHRQLQMFQSGERDVPPMTAQLIGKSDQDLQDLAAHYASLPAKIGEAEATANSKCAHDI